MRKAVLDPLDNTQLILTTDRRVKYDAIRVVRTLYPEIGPMYADSRVAGMRYKTMRWISRERVGQMVGYLNAIFKANGIKAVASINPSRAGWWQPADSSQLAIHVNSLTYSDVPTYYN